MIISKYKSWKKLFQAREKYSTMERWPFFDISKKYLPTNKNATIIDIGAGEGDFSKYLKLQDKYPNHFLLEGNIDNINILQKDFNNVIHYQAPDKLPFDEKSVDYIHCSHLIEHLPPADLYSFLKKIDKVLISNGQLIISSPLLWQGFYGDLSHIKPYNPDVIIKYLCKKIKNSSAKPISQSYEIQEITYRYNKIIESNWGSSIKIIDFCIKLFNKILTLLRIHKYVKNGYTIVLKKM